MGADGGKEYDKWSQTMSFTWAVLCEVCTGIRVGRLSDYEIFQRQWCGTTTQKRQRTPGGKKNQRGEVISLDDASSQQDKNLGVKRATKSSSDLGALVVPWFVYLRLTDVGYSFMGYAKQTGSK